MEPFNYRRDKEQIFWRCKTQLRKGGILITEDSSARLMKIRQEEEDREKEEERKKRAEMRRMAKTNQEKAVNKGSPRKQKGMPFIRTLHILIKVRGSVAVCKRTKEPKVKNGQIIYTVRFRHL